MTTALIGHPGTRTGKARVAIVARQLAGELTEHLSRQKLDGGEFTSWEELATARAGGEPYDLVLYDDAMAGDVPADLDAPAILVSERTSTGGGTTFGVVAPHTLEQALPALAAMAVELRAQATRRMQLEQLASGLTSGQAMVGHCPTMRRAMACIARAADSDATVLVEGPSGSGKSLAARMIHCKSRRGASPLCTADGGELDGGRMTEMLDSARGTTFVVENVDRLPAAAQSVLVKYLKERSGPRTQGAVRIIATTSAHLPELIARGAFREDLYYRLNAFPMVMPALRERVEDIRELAESILMIGATQSGRTSVTITPAAVVLLESTNWPGNVTQLETVVRRAQLLAAGNAVDREHVASSNSVQDLPPQAAMRVVERDAEQSITEDDIRPFEKEEQELLSRALRATKGNVRRAAQLLGIGRATLYRKIQQYKLRLH
ncbi:MAG: sigma 54-interacting transcriptional regulator [Planctomycetota bacterium]